MTSKRIECVDGEQLEHEALVEARLTELWVEYRGAKKLRYLMGVEFKKMQASKARGRTGTFQEWLDDFVRKTYKINHTAAYDYMKIVELTDEMGIDPSEGMGLTGLKREKEKRDAAEKERTERLRADFRAAVAHCKLEKGTQQYIKNRKAEDKQREWEKRRAEAVEQAQAIREDAITAQVTAHDIFSLADTVEPESLDCILTDPPYATEYLHLYGHLRKYAERGLKPGGHLIILCGNETMDRVILEFSQSESLRYRSVGALLLRDARYLAQASQLRQKVKPFLFYRKAGNAIPMKSGINLVSTEKWTATDKLDHDWGQNLMGMLRAVREWTAPEWTVNDPFCGAGSTLVAARMLGRRVSGSDIDPDNVALAKKAIGEAEVLPPEAMEV